MQYTAFLILAPIAAVVSIVIFVATRRYRGSPEITALRWLMAISAGWLFFNSLEVLALTPAMTLFWAKVTYLFIGATPVCWLAFAMQYSSSGTRTWLRTTGIWLLFLIPATTVLLIWTDELRHLVWTSIAFVPVEGFLALQVEYGIAFWISIIHSWALVFLGALFIVHHQVAGLRFYRAQSYWLLIGALIPVLMNVAHVFRFVPGLQKDYTPIGFALAGISCGIGMFWHRLFDLKPIARATLIDRLTDPVITTDLDDRLVDFNPAAGVLLTELCPASEPDGLMGVPLAEAVRGWPEFTDYLRSEARESADLSLTRDGEMRFYECNTSSLHSARNRKIGRLIILHDITERMETERVLRYHMAELEASNDHLDAFAHTVAHDLKGPLSTVIGYVEMLSFYFGELTPEEVRQHLGELVQTGEQMVAIIDALLLFSRVHRQQDLVLDRVEMGDLVAESLDRLAALMAQTGARVAAPAAWPTVFGHGPWLVEVWVNYLTNALKYGGSPPVIELGYDWQPQSRDLEGYVRFWVRDNGAGLTESQIKSLFVPFTRFHASEVPGHGLGLSIVRRIVERLGGHVGVESVLGEGSRFWFTLPAAAAAWAEVDLHEQGVLNAVGKPDVIGL